MSGEHVVEVENKEENIEEGQEDVFEQETPETEVENEVGRPTTATEEDVEETEVDDLVQQQVEYDLEDIEEAVEIEVGSIAIRQDEDGEASQSEDESPSEHEDEEEETEDEDVETEEEEEEEEEPYPNIVHPDTSLIDITQIEEEIEEGSYYGLFGRGLYQFPDLKDPGLDEAFNYGDLPPPADEVGIERYLFVCKALEVVPIARFIKELPGTSINLRYYGLDPRGVRGIAEALFRNKTVETVDLEDNWLTRDAAYHLGEMLKENLHITRLNLTGCRIGPEGARRMKEGILLTQCLEELNLSWNNLGDEGIEELAPGLMDNCSIKKLILSHNHLGFQTGIILAPVLEENWALTDLDLSWNSMYPKEGLKALFFSLVNNHSVTSISLAWNGLSSKEAAKLIKMYLIRGDSIQHLDLSSNRLEGLQIRIIKAGINKNETLQSLKLGRNPMSPDDCNNILKVFQTPTTVIELLDLEGIWVNKEFLQTLKSVRQVRDCTVNIGGVYSNYIIKGPDVKKLLFARANYEAQKPKSKKKKRDFGHFILKLEEKPVKKPKFTDFVAKEKIKLDENLVSEIMKNFPGEKKRVDVPAMKEYYMSLYPDTKLPEKKKKKKRGKGKGKKRKGGKKEKK